MANHDQPDYEGVLRELAQVLLRRALESRSEVQRAGSDEREFQGGRNLAYYEVVDTTARIAEQFGIDPSELGLPPDPLNTIVHGSASAEASKTARRETSGDDT